MISKNTICLWYDGTALEAAKFYAETFPDSAVGAVLRAPGDYPSGKQGDPKDPAFRYSMSPSKRRQLQQSASSGSGQHGNDTTYH